MHGFEFTTVMNLRTTAHSAQP